MIDVKLLLNDFESVAEKLTIKKVNQSDLENLKNLAQTYKQEKAQLEKLQEFKNKASKTFGELMAKKEPVDDLKKQLESNKSNIINSQEKLDSIESKLNEILFSIPNLPDSLTPKGDDENDNVEISRILTPREFSFTPLEHWELGEKLGWIDFAAGVKLAKSRFSVLKGMGAKLNRALINFMLDFNEKHGFSAVVTPVIVNDSMLFGTGQLPKFENDMFKIENSGIDSDESSNRNLYLISTSEITLTNLYNDCILQESDLPICLTAQTPCFRKEAGSAGRDTRGIIRQHQFDKVELVAITTPESSQAMQEKMIKVASSMLETLGLPHRLVQLCGGDLGFSASNTIDIEVWLPAQKCYREISSISNTQDFQARRAKIRYKDKNGKNKLVHTLNGSSLAVGRTLVAIMENYQTQNGDIEIPKALKPYLDSRC